MIREVELDFETRSEAQLVGPKGIGAWKYAEHPSTRIISLAYQIDSGPVRLWIPGWKFPQALRDPVSSGRQDPDMSEQPRCFRGHGPVVGGVENALRRVDDGWAV